MRQELYDYEKIVESFVNKNISVKEFDEKFNERYAIEKNNSDELFQLLDEIFYFIDAYTEVEELIGTEEDYYIDEERLRIEATRLLKEIRELP